ncbi:hypothetical protein KRX57_08650 [Weeksellaceae bacterium TAE3-ERU29]|nr:hypothetical protein [Weeksellaceae bacterium TAE3-ERU29]
MMKLLFIENNVEVFEILYNDLYLGNDSEFWILNSLFDTVEKNKRGVFCIKKFKDNILLQPKNSNDRESLLIANEGLRLIENKVLLFNIIDNEYIYILNSNHTISKYDKKMEEIDSYDVGRFPKIITQEYYIRILSNFISYYKIKQNQLIWQHNFSDLLKGEEIKQHGEIIVHKGILYIYLTSKKNNKNTATIAIDVETGEIKNKYKGFAGKLFLYEDKLYTAGYYKVQILDIETEQISEIDFTDILKPKGLQIHWNNFIVENDYIYFIDGHWATTNKMGILDLKNRKLAWETSIEINDGINNNIREIKISENRLYIHCSDKSLHIFEKDKK